MLFKDPRLPSYCIAGDQLTSNSEVLIADNFISMFSQNVTFRAFVLKFLLTVVRCCG